MDSNNINETLGIENPKENMPDNKELPSNELFKDEEILKKIADIILGVGIIYAIILLITTAFDTSHYKTTIIWSGIVTVITTLLFSIGLWAFLNVISNISISLKKMNKSKDI